MKRRIVIREDDNFTMDFQEGLEAPSEVFPDGRRIFYEGDDPDGFVAEMMRLFAFDPGRDPEWNELFEGHYIRGFFCPPGILDVIYVGKAYPLGS